MERILFLASGGGGTMRFVHHVTKYDNSLFQIVGVLADRECGSTKYCIDNNIEYRIISPWKERTEDIINYILSVQPDIIITNIHKILSEEIISCCNVNFINLHYSLLPSYGGVIGLKTLEMARQNNAQIIGATCHEVNNIVDGGKILSQGAFAVDWSMDNKWIGNTIFRLACKTLLIELYHLCGHFESFPSSDGCLYSPSLNYDDSFMTEQFWSIIEDKK